jgi:hypothetical protein
MTRNHKKSLDQLPLQRANPWNILYRKKEKEMGRTDHMNGVGILGAWHANEEVVWFDIAVYQRFLMNGLQTSDLGYRK